MLDLTEHYDTVRAVVASEYGDAPVDTDDLVQNVCRRILERNDSDSPYDPSRAGPGRYVRVVARSMLSDELNRAAFERETNYDPLEDDPAEPVKPDVEIDASRVDGDAFADWMRGRLDWDDEGPRRTWLLMRLGYERREIASVLDESPRTISWWRRRIKRLMDSYLEET